MPKITVTLTEDQARAVVELINDELAMPQGYQTEQSLAFLARVKASLAEQLAKSS